MRAVAINVGANTNEPGFRGPVRADGTFEYVPIPESEPTAEPVPTYGDLAPHLDVPIPESIHGTPVHLDPSFAGYPCCDRYTYGDDHGVKARPILELDAGDVLLFYATLTTAPDDPPSWMPPDWGAYLVGAFELDGPPVPGSEYASLSPGERARFAGNAHLRREPMDAAVLVAGTDRSRLFDRAVPLSEPTAGVDPNDLVTDLSSDSGKGPWWRRPLRFEGEAAATLLARCGFGTTEQNRESV
ncbi:MAG: hypothetical protein ABEJ06_06480 [Haloarculaceae archaeon]